MDLHLLGQVEATLDGRPIPLGATKQRAVLAMLALQPNATVAVDRLVDGLWGEDPPASAPKMVQLYVSQLRRLFAGDGAQIVTHGRGYELRVPPDAVDVARFERLVDKAGRSDRLPNEAARNALALSHGAPLADVAAEPFAAAEIRRLEELWLRAAELAVDSDLAAGHDHEALAQLERLIEEHPLRERLHAQRMLALYRSGRQAEALEAYAAVRRRLVEEIGVEPGAELRDLQGRVLAQDPSLLLPAASAEMPAARHETRPLPREARPQARRPLVLALIAVAVTAITIFAVTRFTDTDSLPGIEEGAVGVIDSNAGEITAQYRIGSEPGAVAEGAGSVWVASPREGTVSRIHRDGDRVDTIDVGPAPAALAFGSGSLWVAAGEDGAVAQVDPTANRVVQRIPVGNGLEAVAVGHGAVWAATALDGEVVRIDLRSGRVTRRIAVGGHPVALATGAGAVWAAAEDSGNVVRIDPGSGDVLEAIAVGNGPSALAVGFGAVWVANRQDGTVSRIDPATGRVTDTLPAGRAPVALVAAGGALWVADAAGTVLRLDPGSRTITESVRTGSTPAALAAVDSAVWVAAAASPAAHRGGTLRLGSLPIALDPAVGGYEPDAIPVIGLAYDGLMAYRREGGAAGARLAGGGSRSLCPSPSTVAGATSSGCAPVFATPTAGRSAPAISGPRWGARGASRGVTCRRSSTRSRAELAAEQCPEPATSRAASPLTTGRGPSPFACAGPTPNCSKS
jgi:YVTN family beta-propeller protein